MHIRRKRAPIWRKFSQPAGNFGTDSQNSPHFHPIHRHNSQYQTRKFCMGVGNLLGFLMVSILTGFACAVISVVAYGAGLWIALLWYVIGCWIGFAMPVLAYLVASLASKTNPDQSYPEYP